MIEDLSAFVYMILLLGIVAIVGFIVVYGRSIYLILKPKLKMSEERKYLLVKNIKFYNRLDNKGKYKFEYRVEDFITSHKFTGVNTEVNETDIILIAASAIIPVFAFPDWEYNTLMEIFVFPDNFNEDFQTNSTDSYFRGLVGFGFLEGKLLISRTALYEGFYDYSDKRNTCLHEFIHLIDKSDGSVDGVPKDLLESKYYVPWMILMKREMDKIKMGKSDIHPYATKNAAEFFAVIAEYFFERPDDFKIEHPELFRVMNKIFKQPIIK